MHLLAAQPGGFADGEGIIDLDQSPADMVILSAGDGVLAMLAQAAERLPADFPSLRLANWRNLSKPAALDLYRDRTLDRARVVVVSLIGGRAYWPYGVEQLSDWAQAADDRQLIVVPGEDYHDDDVFALSTVDYDTAHRVWRYTREGGADNAEALMRFLAATCLDRAFDWSEPTTLARALIHHPQRLPATLADWRARWPAGHDRPVAVVVLYRSHLQNGNTAVFDALYDVLMARGLNPLPVAVASLKEPACLAAIDELIEAADAAVVLNTTGFALRAASNAATASDPGTGRATFARDIPVLQLIPASTTADDWAEQNAGLRSRDLAMYVVLPELDGRIVTRAVAFKTLAYRSQRCEIDVVRHELMPERAAFVADLARRWASLQTRPNADKRVALILANNPGTDGRIGNGVGLDTPASTLELLEALRANDYDTGALPHDSTALMDQLRAAVSNDTASNDFKPSHQSLDIAVYEDWFATLPAASQAAVLERWGEPRDDPKHQNGRLQIAGLRFGNVFVGPQPARGFGIDLAANYHDPDLVPPHGYLAFYAWLREVYGVDAVVHVGKHGNLEWLPGKSVALSRHCWPDIALGPMPQLYPFIVNDPGEGAQAKRRSQAVIIDHMTPPIVRAESHGALAELEGLVDEYFEASGLDRRRETYLRDRILEIARRSHVADEIAEDPDDDDAILAQLDTYICDLKEAQIRGGLHRLGRLPERAQLAETLVSLTRMPRGEGATDRGLLHALAADLELGDFDPLRVDGQAWHGPKPTVLAALSSQGWRTDHHTRERLEQLAVDLVTRVVVDGDTTAVRGLTQTAALLDYIRDTLLPALTRGVADEIAHTLGGLNGRFVPPGPSGAPTRGRLDTLPTGRNFYTVDSRAIPTTTAWELGKTSAEALVTRHLQEQGDYPRRIGLSVWGTATMRTGGDDIAQAFALMGVKPVWAPGSNRLVDFEIVPAFQLGRPRVDVTLRVSGFFRDAFAGIIRLFDAAVRGLAAFEDPGDGNTIRANIEQRAAELRAQGHDHDSAMRQACFRVFGSQPGTYGSGLSERVDGGDWSDSDDLADAYVERGGYAYGEHEYGEAAFDAFNDRLEGLEAVIQNQDNREHDILDSADYYQFQGGMANAARSRRSGRMPTIYHGDHSNPGMPRIRTLTEEINRVVRTRVTNPKWIGAMQGHGYKGAFEMAATVDYLFAYDATTQVVDDYQYAAVSDALILDDDNRAFVEAHNPDALRNMSERMLEAMQRGLWHEPGAYRERIENAILELEEGYERPVE